MVENPASLPEPFPVVVSTAVAAPSPNCCQIRHHIPYIRLQGPINGRKTTEGGENSLQFAEKLRRVSRRWQIPSADVASQWWPPHSSPPPTQSQEPNGDLVTARKAQKLSNEHRGTRNTEGQTRVLLVDKISGEAKLLLKVLGEGVTDPLNCAKLT